MKNTCCPQLGGILHLTGSRYLAATMGAGSAAPDTIPAAAFIAVSFSTGTIARETSAVATSDLPSLALILARVVASCRLEASRNGREKC